jgi:hypothetical protein
MLALVVIGAMSRSRSWSQRFAYPASRLHGTASLHLPADEEDRYLFLANTISDNCDLLFTLPGMGSLNYWSGVPTPNGLNVTVWVKAFSPERQQRILEILKANPRACSVYNARLANFWGVSSEELSGVPLARYILHDMRKVAERDGYHIRVHPRRDSPWVVDPHRLPH